MIKTKTKNSAIKTRVVNVLLLFVVVVTFGVVAVLASAPAGGYFAGQNITDPACSPDDSDVNCFINYLWKFNTATSPVTVMSTSTNSIGIGTSTPQAKLEVNGDIKLGMSTTTCDSSSKAGTMRFNSSTGNFEECDGSGWYKLGSSCGSVTSVSYEGQTYDTVSIGTQCWFAENLNVGQYVPGYNDMNISDNTIQKWCYDEDNSNPSSSDCNGDNALYRWEEAMQGSTTEPAQGICPAGWHIPTDAEWYTLENGLATGSCDANRTTWSCDPAGTKLKVGGSSSFEGVLTGYRDTNGSFHSQGTYADFWSSTESGGDAWMRYLSSGHATVYRTTATKGYGYSVRCLKD